MNFEFDEALSKIFTTVKETGQQALTSVSNIGSIPEYRKFAEEEALKAYGKKEEHNQRGDAMRHILFSALNTQNIGSLAAKTISYGHELSEAFIQPPFEKEMDLHNDAIGRRIAEQAKSREDMIRLTKEAIDSGEAKFYSKTNQPNQDY
jgi:hypothetical protein